MFSLLLKYIKQQYLRVIIFAIILFSSIVLQIINPQILGYFIDKITATGETIILIKFALFFTVIAFLQQICGVIATYLGENIAWTATNWLRVDLVRHCLNLDLGFYHSHTSGELIERVDGDVNTLSRFFSEFSIYVLGNFLLLIGILIALFLEDWRAGISLTLFTLTALIILIKLRPLAVAYWGDWRQMNAEFFSFLGEQIAAKDDIWANGALNYAMHRFYQIIQRWLPSYHRARLSGTILWGTSLGLFALGNAIALSVGAYLYTRQMISLGGVYLIFHYTNLLREPINQIRTQLEDLQQAEASILRVKALFQVKSFTNTLGNRQLPNGALSFALENVSFSYDRQELVIKNISFTLSPGKILGILGHTGSGKSTLIRLLLRLYQPQQGNIYLANIPLEEIEQNSLRERVGIITQDVQLFQSTIRDNLTFFNPQISDIQLYSAFSELGLQNWLNALPNGLDTYLGSNGKGLSAGEAQLVALVRIFLKNPGLVILDEASSRLDPQTEKTLQTAITQLLQNRTGIIIAHRLATLENCDRLLILHQGEIIESGDRHTLINNDKSRFAQLLNMSV